jgi:hypothetical protein
MSEMTGTASQVEWAVQIKARVAKEFDRVAHAFFMASERQSKEDRADTWCVIAILEAKRSEVMANDRAGYFITIWQELSGQVRELIAADPRYQAIKTSRERRRRLTTL